VGNVLARYQRLRPIRLRLNNTLACRLSRETLNQGAKRLGMLRRGTVVFETEDETSVLLDYCIYDVYRNGRNAVEQYLCDSPPDPDSDEMTLLRAMQHATYTVLAVTRVEPGIGCHVRNLLTDEVRLLVDIGFSNSVCPGAVLATRLMDFGEYVATGGAALPLGVLDDDKLDQWRRKFSMLADSACHDPAPLIRALLQSGASSHIRYEGATSQRRFAPGGKSSAAAASATRRREHATRQANRPVGNQRCRCGSGKMFKNCCGKRSS
jgi:hypothetical protein